MRTDRSGAHWPSELFAPLYQALVVVEPPVTVSAEQRHKDADHQLSNLLLQRTDDGFVPPAESPEDLMRFLAR